MAVAETTGDLATKFRVNDDDPMASIPTLEQRNADPIEFGYYLQDMIVRAEKAYKDKDWQRAIKYYEPLARAVPDRAITFSRLCLSYAELGQVDSAVNACSNAIHRDGALVMDHLRFIHLSLRKAELSTNEIGEIDSSLAHLRAHVGASANQPPTPANSADGEEDKVENFVKSLKDGPGQAPTIASKTDSSKVDLRIEIEVLACKVAIRLRDSERVERCLASVRDANLHPSVLIPIEWARALIAKDATRATALLQQAKKAGLPGESLKAMAEEQLKELGVAPSLGSRRWVYYGLAGLVGLLFVLWAAMRSSTVAKRSKPETASVRA